MRESSSVPTASFRRRKALASTAQPSFAEDEACLRLRSVGRVHHEQHAVNHAHGALDFTAEIGVAGSVYNIDAVTVPLKRSVFRANRDALFALEIHRVHHPFLDLLIRAKGA